MKPLITISILSFNRLEDLAITIDKVLALKYEPLEIIVLDQGSTDGTYDYLMSFKDNIKVIMRPKGGNLGIAGGRQRILEASTGEFILTIDDDSYPEEGVLEKAIEWFTLNPELGAIGCNLMPPNCKYVPAEIIPKKYETKQYQLFTGSGAIIRRKALKHGWDSEFKCSCEDTDAGLQIIANGYQIASIADLVVRHAYSPKGRSYNHKLEKFADGYVRRSYKYMPDVALDKFLLMYTLDAIKFCIRHRTLAYLKPLFKVNTARNPIPMDIFSKILLPYQDLFGYYQHD